MGRDKTWEKGSASLGLPSPSRPAAMGVTDLGDVSPSCADDVDGGEETDSCGGGGYSDTDPAASHDEDSQSEPDVCGSFAGDGDATVVESQGARRPVFESLDGSEAVAARYASHLSCVCAVLGCSPDDAALLLRHFKWNVSRVSEEYFQARGGAQAARATEELTGPSTLVHPVSLALAPRLASHLQLQDEEGVRQAAGLPPLASDALPAGEGDSVCALCLSDRPKRSGPLTPAALPPPVSAPAAHLRRVL